MKTYHLNSRLENPLKGYFAITPYLNFIAITVPFHCDIVVKSYFACVAVNVIFVHIVTSSSIWQLVDYPHTPRGGLPCMHNESRQT